MAQSMAKLNQQIYEAAGDWLVRHRTGSLDAAEKKAFDAWLRTSPEHILAYCEMSAIWEDVAAVAPDSPAEAAELIRRASADPLSRLPERRGRADRLQGPAYNHAASFRGIAARALAHRYRLAAAVAALCIAAGVASWWVREPGYSTGIGEQRAITLADGSTVELNARSEIKVHFAAHERDIELVHGEALFHVAKDAARPFIVRAGGTFVRAVGTQFDVNDFEGGTIVTVVEGLVAVFVPPQLQVTGSTTSSGDLPPSRRQAAADLLRGLHGMVQPIFVRSDQQIAVTATRLREPAAVNVAAATAWAQHRFVFDATPLAEVVAEFNRYNARQLVITDPQLDDLQIDGFFSSSDPSLLLKFLRNQPEISVSDAGSEILISRK